MNKEFANIINTMTQVDQEARFNVKDKFLIYALDGVHQSRIRQLINTYGYPSIDLVGEEAIKNFWLLVQHQDFDIGLQKECLNKCNFPPMEYAHLYDRIQINSGLDQKFGTQLNQLIKNLNETNSSRTKIGWITIEEYIKEFNSKEERQLGLRLLENGGAEYIK